MNNLWFFAGADHFTIFNYFLRIDHHYVHVAVTALVAIFLYWFSRRIHAIYTADREAALIPEERLTDRNIIEMACENLLKLFQSILHDDAQKYFPLLASIFLYVFLSNLFGMIPGFIPPTQNVNTNFAVGIVVFLYYNYQGFKEHGAAYLKHFLGPVWWMAWLMLPIELISHIVRPISLSLRLYGNMTGDHAVLGAFSELTPLFVPMIFMALGLFVCFLQAFVFTLLSSLYIAMAVSHDH